MTDAIVIAILAVIILVVIRYIVKEKKKGHACIGCPNAGCCSKSCGHIQSIDTKK